MLSYAARHYFVLRFEDRANRDVTYAACLNADLDRRRGKVAQVISAKTVVVSLFLCRYSLGGDRSVNVDTPRAARSLRNGNLSHRRVADTKFNLAQPISPARAAKHRIIDRAKSSPWQRKFGVTRTA